MHRNIKAENILVRRRTHQEDEYNIVLADFSDSEIG